MFATEAASFARAPSRRTRRTAPSQDRGFGTNKPGGIRTNAFRARFSQRIRYHQATGELWSFGLRMGLRSRLMLYRADATDTLDAPKSLDLDKANFVHDFVLTPQWLGFVLSPMSFGIGRMILGAAPLPRRSARRTRRSELLVLDAETLESVATFALPPSIHGTFHEA